MSLIHLAYNNEENNEEILNLSSNDDRILIN